jgi:D-alanyl-lipoteichoic acid acyltransferase DltB (MBOAT superfamily)
MDTASLQFIAFGLIVAFLSNLSRAPRWRTAVLLLASIGFVVNLAGYALALIPFAAFLALGYLCMLALARGWTSNPAPGIVAIILAFLWLKKYSFLPQATFLNFPYFTLGLSYVFFRVLQLVIEAPDPGARLATNPVSCLAYTLNFTTLVSGPIQRYEAFATDQFAPVPPPLGLREIGAQLERIIRGYFKVNVLALILNILQTDAFNELPHRGDPARKLAAGLKLIGIYPFFLYCNFSGYIDVVMGLARLIRLELPENFDRPFSASSLLEFWNRWHITLSTWLKTYVYNPLFVALLRKFPQPSLQAPFAVLSFFVTFFLIGLWHGRTSEFVVFGAFHGGGVATNKMWQIFLTDRLGRKGYRALSANPAYEAFGRGLTFTWFALSLLWFRFSWKEIGAAFSAIGPARWFAVLAVLLIASGLLLSAWEWLRKAGEIPVLNTRYVRVVYATCLIFVWLVMRLVINQPAPDIVYKAF